MNQVIRRLERVEGDLLAERHARVDDLALLVDLVTLRLARRRAAPRAHRGARVTRPTIGAVVYRIDRQASSSSLSRQHELEAAPAPRLALELDAAAERDRELARDREAEPGAAAVARPERAEDAVALLRADPGAGVGDRDRDRAVLRRQLNSTRPPSGVQRNAFESRLTMICSTRSPSVMITGCASNVEPVVDRALARLLAERRVRALDELLHVDLFLQHREAVRVELREVEHVADEPLEPHRLLADHVERRLAHRRDRR